MNDLLLDELVADAHARPLPALTARRAKLPWVPRKADANVGMRRTGKTWLMVQRMRELVEAGTPREDLLYVNCEGTLKCLKWPSNKVQWATRNDDRNLLGLGGSMLRVGGDKLILLSQSGRLSLARATPQGFERISSVPDVVEGGEVWASPAIHDGKLYIKGERELVCIDLKAK